MANDHGATRPYLDQLIQAHAWDPSTLKRISDEFHGSKARTVPSAAGWHGADDIQTLVGLEGRFLWAENPLDPVQIAFTFAPDHVGYQGSYQMTRLGAALESGTFYSVPNNPAMGWAAVTLLPTGSKTPRSTVVSGMLTDSEWRIEVMLLNKLGAQGLEQPAFPAVRTA